MLVLARSYQGYTLSASDRKVGKITDLYFDEEKWGVRYLVVHVGWPIFGRDALVSPLAVRAVDADFKRVLVNLDIETIENAPPLSPYQPISRQYEAYYHDYYDWPYYWFGDALWGLASTPEQLQLIEQSIDQSLVHNDEVHTHLRSIHEIIGYSVMDAQQAIGTIEDVIIESDSWLIRYLVLRSPSWLPSKRHLISRDWVTGIDWSNQEATIELDHSMVEASPEYNPGMLVSRSYENRLYSHYGMETYWKSGE